MIIGNTKGFIRGKALSTEGHAHSGSDITGLTASRALVSSIYGKVAVSTITLAELGYLDGVTSNIQTQLNKKASSSHTHTAIDITSGTLGTARGGTGITTNPSLLVNLASTAAASVFATSPRPGVTGTLPVAKGGTGVTSLDALKTALGISGGSFKYETGTYKGSQSSTTSRFGKNYPQSITFTQKPVIVWVGDYNHTTSQDETQFGIFFNFDQVFSDDRGSNISNYGIGLFCDNDRTTIVPLCGSCSGTVLTFWGTVLIDLAGSANEKPYYQFADNMTTYQYGALTVG